MLRPWTLPLKDRVGIAPDTPRYMQIAHGLIHEIERGRLLPGEYLPSSRDLAAALEVNRKTIVTAYDELMAQGWLVSAGTRGTMVSTSLPRAEESYDDAPAPGVRLPQHLDFARTVEGLQELLAGAGLDVFETEPLPPENPLWQMPNVMITPHVAACSPHIATRHLETLCHNVRQFAAGLPLINVANKEKWY